MNKPIECAGCFFKTHRPPIDEAWIGALMAMVGFELLKLCPEHRGVAIDFAKAMSGGASAQTVRARLRVIDGGRAPRREPPRPPRRR